MLNMPADSQSYASLLGIDPGSTTVGIAVINFDISSLEIVSSAAWTINGAKLMSKDSWFEELYGNRYSRVSAIENQLLEILNYYQPVIVVSESPFINSKFPAAGIALTEVMCSIRRAVAQYDIWKRLEIVPPSSVKNAIKAAGGAGKDEMKDKLGVLLPMLKYNGVVPFNMLDEHAIDALAVALYNYTKIQK